MLVGNKMFQCFLSGTELDLSLTPLAVSIKIVSYRKLISLIVTEEQDSDTVFYKGFCKYVNLQMSVIHQ